MRSILRFSVLFSLLAVLAQLPSTRAGAHPLEQGCVASSTVTCADIVGSPSVPPKNQTGNNPGGVVTDSGRPIKSALVQFNGVMTRAAADGTYQLVAPVVLHNGCGTFFIHVWAPGYVEERFSYRVCHIERISPLIGWNEIPLESAYVDDLCHAHIYGLKQVIPVGGRLTFYGTSSYGCVPFSPATLLQLPSGRSHPCHLTRHPYGCLRQIHLRLKLGKTNRFWASIPKPAPGSYFLEIQVNDKRLSLFDFPIYVGTAPTQFPDRAVKPDPLLVNDPTSVHHIKQLAPTVAKIINANRYAAGFHRALTQEKNLRLAAQNHAYDMAARHFFYFHPHVGYDGSGISERIHRYVHSCPHPNEAVSAIFPPQYQGHLAGGLVLPLLISEAQRMTIMQSNDTTMGVGIGYDTSLKLLELTVDMC